MPSTNKLRVFLTVAIILGCFSVQVENAKTKEKKSKPEGTPVLWKQPTDISSRDLFLGPGGEAMRPDLRRLTVLKEEKGGYSKKYRVRDASGRVLLVRVAFAYRLYLRFRHAVAVAIASQVIVWLILAKLTLDVRFFQLY